MDLKRMGTQRTACPFFCTVKTPSVSCWLNISDGWVYALVRSTCIFEGDDTVKNRIRELRLQRKMTQEQLGELAGASRQAIHAVETGKFEPSIWLAYAIARVFSLPIEEVFLFEESMPKTRADSSRGRGGDRCGA